MGLKPIKRTYADITFTDHCNIIDVQGNILGYTIIANTEDAAAFIKKMFKYVSTYSEDNRTYFGFGEDDVSVESYFFNEIHQCEKHKVTNDFE